MHCQQIQKQLQPMYQSLALRLQLRIDDALPAKPEVASEPTHALATPPTRAAFMVQGSCVAGICAHCSNWAMARVFSCGWEGSRAERVKVWWSSSMRVAHGGGVEGQIKKVHPSGLGSWNPDEGCGGGALVISLRPHHQRQDTSQARITALGPDLTQCQLMLMISAFSCGAAHCPLAQAFGGKSEGAQFQSAFR